MNILIIPDSFKGSLSSIKVSDAICEGVKKVLPKALIKKIPFSDGGEGGIDFLENNGEGEIENIITENSVGSRIQAPIYWIKKNEIAWIELSQSSGLSSLNPKERNPMLTSTFGSGMLVDYALKKGCKKMYIGLGGSSTHDLGSGIFTALGGKLLDENSQAIPRGGQGLLVCEKINFNTLNPRAKTCKIILAVDVNNKLLGLNGAAKIYSAQKGADFEMIQNLENGSKKFADLIKKIKNKDITKIKGGGAAGGAAGGLYGLINAKIEYGFEIFNKLINLEAHIFDADLIITGEGHLDHQSSFGKLIGRIGVLAKKNNKPLICIAGKVSLSAKKSKSIGITKAWSSRPPGYSMKKSMDNAYELIKNSAEKAIQHHIN